MPPVKILIITPVLNASSIIGITRPLIEFEKRGLVTLRLRYGSIPFGWKKDCDWCDVAVFNRAQNFEDLRTLYYLKRTGKKVIYDIDDNFLEIPITVRVGQNHRFYTKIFGTTQFYKLADITRVYSERLKQQVLSYGGAPTLINSYFDLDIIKDVTPTPQNQKIKIAFASARIDDPELDRMTNDVLTHIAETYRDKVELHFWRKPNGRLGTMDNIIVHTPNYRYEDFIRNFYRIGFDIGLAPLMDHVFYHSKSNNKYREYGGMGIASVYSNVPPYKDCITNGHNGLLADNNKDSWIAAIESLINSKDVRDKISAQSRRDVETHYSFQNAMADWHAQIQEVMKLPAVTINTPYLESEKPFPLHLLVGSRFESGESKDDNAQLNIVTSHLSQACTHLKVKLTTAFLSQFYLNVLPDTKTRYYTIVHDEMDLDMLMPMVSQKRSVAIDLRLAPILSSTMLETLNNMQAMNPDNLTIVCLPDQSELLPPLNKIILESPKPIHALDYFDTAYAGIDYCRYIESVCYNKLYMRVDFYRDKLKTLFDILLNSYQTFRRRAAQIMELILWRIGQRKQ